MKLFYSILAVYRCIDTGTINISSWQCIFKDTIHNFELSSQIFFLFFFMTFLVSKLVQKMYKSQFELYFLEAGQVKG